MNCTDPKIVRKIKITCILSLLIFAVIDAIFYFSTTWYAHPHFEADKTQIDKYSFLFFPVFGFLACVAMVIGSKKIVSLFLKRKDTYYND